MGTHAGGFAAGGGSVFAGFRGLPLVFPLAGLFNGVEAFISRSVFGGLSGLP